MLQSVERLTERLVAHTEYPSTDQELVEMVIGNRADVEYLSIVSPTVELRLASPVKPQSKPPVSSSSNAKYALPKHRSIMAPYNARSAVAASSQPKLKPAGPRSAVGLGNPAYRSFAAKQQQPRVASPKLKLPKAPQGGNSCAHGLPTSVHFCTSNSAKPTTQPTNGILSGGAVTGLKSSRKSYIPGSIPLPSSTSPNHITSKLFRPPTTSSEACLKGSKIMSSALQPLPRKATNPSGAIQGALGMRRPGPEGGIVEGQPRTTHGTESDKKKKN